MRGEISRVEEAVRSERLLRQSKNGGLEMAGVRGVRNPYPTAGGKPTGIFSTRGSQKKDSVGDGFKPSMTAKAMDAPRKGPVKRDNGLK